MLALIESLSTGRGTLSDRLNPDHPCFDASLKAQWKSLPKRGRAAIVAADASRLKALAATVEHPFDVETADHCESPPEAYSDVVEMLDMLAAKLGKDRRTLAIYDPYYCAGGMKKHLESLGFLNVYHKCEDFYQVLAEGRVPAHDCLVTNPPYSEDHFQRLLRFAHSNAKTLKWLNYS